MKEVRSRSFPRKTSVDLSSPFESEGDEYNSKEFRAKVSKEDFFLHLILKIMNNFEDCR